MIIQVRGTSGSGKTTVVRRVMQRLGDYRKEYLPGRRAPYYYIFDRAYVLGSYENVCGGCDMTVKRVEEVCQLATKLQQENGKVVLCEGLLLSEDVKWSKSLSELHVVFLDTNLEECLERVVKRRTDKGNRKPFNTEKSVKRFHTINRAQGRLVDLGINCCRMDCDTAVERILEWIGE